MKSINNFTKTIDDIKFLISQYLTFDEINKLKCHQQLSKRLILKDDGFIFKFIFQRDFGENKTNKNIFNFGENKSCFDRYQEIKEDIKDKNLNDQLIYASRNNLLNLVKSSINNKANVHANDDSALRLAAENGHLEVVKFLVDNKANVHANNDEALRWADFYGHLEIVRYLVDNKANVHAVDDYALRWTRT